MSRDSERGRLRVSVEELPRADGRAAGECMIKGDILKRCFWRRSLRNRQGISHSEEGVQTHRKQVQETEESQVATEAGEVIGEEGPGAVYDSHVSIVYSEVSWDATDLP